MEFISPVPSSPDPDPDPDPDPLNNIEMNEPSSRSAIKRHRETTVPVGSSVKKLITSQESASASIQSVYQHPSLTILGIRQYEDTDTGPYLVHVSRVETDATAGTVMRPIKFGQFVATNNIQNVCRDGIKKVGRNKVSIQFKNASAANLFVENPTLKINNYDAAIPTFNVTRMGIVRGVPVDWSMDEFVASLQIPGNSYVLKARRLNRKNKIENIINWVPTQTVVLSFRGQQLPDKIYSFYSSLEVEAYQFPTIQCMNCLRFGHIKTQCRSQPRCYRCTQPHSGDSCDVQESQATCLYCLAHHYSTSRVCPEQDRQRNIKSLMAQKGMSYQEACGQMPKITKSYSQITKDAPVSHNLGSQHIPPSSSSLPKPSISLKKNTIHKPKPNPPLGKSFDRAAHQSIIAQGPSSLPRGYALQTSQLSSSPSDTHQLLLQLLTIIINLISQSPNSLPSNVAQSISQLSSLVDHHGLMPNDSMEQQEPS